MNKLLFVPLILIFMQNTVGFETQTKELKLLFLGDSYTIGEGVIPGDNYPNQLVKSLKKQGLNIASPTIIAKTGWTTSELMDRLMEEEDLSGYDATFLLIGVNNQYRGLPTYIYEKEFPLLLNHAVSFTRHQQKKVFVISIPDYGYTLFGKDKQPVISKGIERYNAINKNFSELAGVNYIDITDISRKGLKEQDYLVGDGLHPSGKQYQQWVSLVSAKAFPILKDQ